MFKAYRVHLIRLNKLAGYVESEKKNLLNYDINNYIRICSKDLFSVQLYFVVYFVFDVLLCH